MLLLDCRFMVSGLSGKNIGVVSGVGLVGVFVWLMFVLFRNMYMLLVVVVVVFSVMMVMSVMCLNLLDEVGLLVVGFVVVVM